MAKKKPEKQEEKKETQQVQLPLEETKADTEQISSEKEQPETEEKDVIEIKDIKITNVSLTLDEKRIQFEEMLKKSWEHNMTREEYQKNVMNVYNLVFGEE